MLNNLSSQKTGNESAAAPQGREYRYQHYDWKGDAGDSRENLPLRDQAANVNPINEKETLDV
jgi:hypothetical protein